MATIAKSPAAAASAGPAALACGPSSLIKPASESGPWVLLSTTSYPWVIAAFARLLPTCPLPRIPMVVMSRPPCLLLVRLASCRSDLVWSDLVGEGDLAGWVWAREQLERGRGVLEGEGRGDGHHEFTALGEGQDAVAGAGPEKPLSGLEAPMKTYPSALARRAAAIVTTRARSGTSASDTSL